MTTQKIFCKKHSKQRMGKLFVSPKYAQIQKISSTTDQYYCPKCKKSYHVTIKVVIEID